MTRTKKRITQEELREIIRLHVRLLSGKEGGGIAELRRVDLRGLYLRDAYLRCACLYDVDLRWADLSGANLSLATLTDSTFRHADMRCVNLSRADLMWVDFSNADLSGANLRGADLAWANLRGANLTAAMLDYQIEEGLLQKVAQAALASDCALDMLGWQNYKGTHCIAGWACHLAKNGKEMEGKYGRHIAGLLLLGAEAYSHFFDTDQDARTYLRSVLEGVSA